MKKYIIKIFNDSGINRKFLCSKDIDKNDLVGTISGVGKCFAKHNSPFNNDNIHHFVEFPNITNDNINTNIGVFNQNEIFKIEGIISHENYWIKENFEIEPDDIMIVTSSENNIVSFIHNFNVLAYSNIR